MVVIRSRGDNKGNFGFRNSEFLRSSMVEQVGGYEELRSFYLGKEDDIEKSEVTDDFLLYDSKDLVTHGVVLGMTGSGETGLCIGLP